jgi:hypothetical protein
MKIIISILFLLLGADTLFAQQDSIKKPSVDKNKKWSFGVILAPGFSNYINTYNPLFTPQFAYEAGINIACSFSDRIFVSTAIGFRSNNALRKKIPNADVDVHGNVHYDSTATSVAYHTSYLTIPVMFNYKFLSLSKQQKVYLLVSTGITMNYIINNTLTFRNYLANGNQTGTDKFDVTDKSSPKFGLSINFGLGIFAQLSPRISGIISPTYLRDVAPSKGAFNSLHTTITFYYTLSSKK